MKQNTDLAIYINCEMGPLIAWLNEVVGPLDKTAVLGETTIYSSSFGPIIVSSSAEEGSYISVWLNSPTPPWPTHVDLRSRAGHVDRIADVILATP